MLSFASDYIAGCHPEVLKRLVETNLENLSGYGTDLYTKMAIEKVKQFVGKDDAQVYFLTGGTQTNHIIIDSMLEAYQGVVSANTGHISAHEAGAIEYTGHKVLALNSKDGKIKADEIETYISNFYKDENYEHMVFPGMVYISYPTEYGTLYTKDELREIYSVCKQFDIPLFIDGARLGYGLASKECDLTINELANLCDVFYIGGTKVGALCGEALVFTHNNMPKHFNTRVKQHGAMIAKGRILGIQFDSLFTDDLYIKISKHAIDMAEKLKTILEEKNYEFFLKSPTNQQFVIIENSKMKDLAKDINFGFWESYDQDHTVIRFATSWSTTDEDLEKLKKLL